MCLSSPTVVSVRSTIVRAVRPATGFLAGIGTAVAAAAGGLAVIPLLLWPAARPAALDGVARLVALTRFVASR